MNINSPEILYLALILPSLFAVTLIAEGVNKILKKEPGWLSFCLGLGFLIFVIIGYFFIIK